MSGPDVPALVRLLGGAATVGALRQRGATRYAVEQAVATGTLLRVGHGAVAVAGAPESAVVAARTHGVPTCVSTLAARGIRLVIQPVRPHLATSRPRTERSVTWHRDRIALAPDDLVAATLRAAACLPESEALAAVDNVLFQRLVSHQRLLDHCPRAPTRQVRWILQHCDGASESVLESVLRHLLLRAGITDVELQHRIPGVGLVDVLVGGWLIVEADGHAFHSDRESIRRDNARSAMALTQGYLTLRFGYDELIHHRPSVLATVTTALRRGREGHFRTRQPR